ncbi:MAG: LptF/LptG family permease [Bryobacterales bacterium]|nr:LptF/LptG family permease [Bryobacterales bacterium]
MRLLSRYVLFECVRGTLLGVVLFTFVLFLQRISKLFEPMVRGSASLFDVAWLFVLVLPPALTFTIPLGVLVGVLIGLSRMASDGEITAIRANGISARMLLRPVLVFAGTTTLFTAFGTTVLTPAAIKETYNVLNRLIADQLTAEIQPRIFEEQFPGMVLYVGDVIPGQTVRWRNVFIADTRPPEERDAANPDGKSNGPLITVARETIATPDIKNNRIQLSLFDGTTHEPGETDNEYFNSSFPRSEQMLVAQAPSELRAKAYSEMDMGPLYRELPNSVEARIEWHQRLALPFACLLLCLIGMPLGVSTRRGGKSAAVVLTVALAFLYYVGLVTAVGLARGQTMPAWLAMWLPNILFGITGIFLILRLEKPGDSDWMTSLQFRWKALLARLPRRGASSKPFSLPQIHFLPQLIDTAILNSFLFYFGVFLASFVLLTHIYTFFELLSSMMKNDIPMSRMFTYLFFLTPRLIYDAAPMSVLVAVLVTFGVMSKQNEVTAYRACGVSVMRLALPVMLVSFMLSITLFLFDHYYVPEANRIQDGIRREIKGRPAQTYLNPGKQWIYGEGNRIYYYKYFDPDKAQMIDVSVFEFATEPFRIRRHMKAEYAEWEPSVQAWVFHKGWIRDIDGVQEKSFWRFDFAPIRELNEPPGYFLKEVKQDKQMNFIELEQYIEDLQQSGFDTVRLRIQLHKKFSVPLFAFIMSLISIPFAFLAGNRGAMAGVGFSFGIAIAYWVANSLFEQVGNLNQLPAVAAAWAPDGLFLLAGAYLITRMRS